MPQPSWSAPTLGIGNTPAELQAGYKVDAAPIAGVLNAILQQKAREQEQLQQGVKSIAGGVSGFMQQRKSDQIAQTLLDQASNYDSVNPTDTEAIARALNESEARPTDAWKAFNQTRQSNLKADTEEARAARYNEMATRLSGKAPGGAKPVTDPLAQALKPLGATKEDLDAFVESGSPVEFRDKDGAVIDMEKADRKSYAVLKTGEGNEMKIDFPKYQQIRRLYGKTTEAKPEMGGGEDISDALAKGPAPIASQNEVIRVTKDGKRAVFDAATKEFLRYADSP